MIRLCMAGGGESRRILRVIGPRMFMSSVSLVIYLLNVFLIVSLHLGTTRSRFDSTDAADTDEGTRIPLRLEFCRIWLPLRNIKATTARDDAVVQIIRTTTQSTASSRMSSESPNHCISRYRGLSY